MTAVQWMFDKKKLQMERKLLSFVRNEGREWGAR